MKYKARGCKQKLLPIFVAFTAMFATAIAQDTGRKETCSASVGSAESNTMVNADKSIVESKQRELLDELLEPDTANQAEQTGKEEPCDIDEYTLAAP